MVGTIRRNIPEPGMPDNLAGAPPPAYTPTSPTTVPAAAFARTNARPVSSPNPQQSTRPLSSAQPQGQQHTRPASSISQRTGSQQQRYSQPSGPPPQAAPARTPTASASGSTLNRSNTREDPLSVLRRYDTCLLIDDSASMYDLWREAEAALAGIAEQVVKYDADGVDVHFLNDPNKLIGAKSAHDIRELFQHVGPYGESTPTEVKVEELLSSYVDACEAAKARNQPLPKPLNLLVLTDGEADDPPTLAYALTGFAKRLDDIRAPLSQLGVQFVQIGNDPTATESLRELDDELQGVRDMVDTTPYQGKVTTEFLVKTTLGSINRRIDRSS